MDPNAAAPPEAVAPVDAAINAHAEEVIEVLIDAPPEAPVQHGSSAQKALRIPEIVLLIGSYLPLFQHRFEAGRFRFVDIWDPKPLLRAGAVCSLWHNVLTPVLWQTFDLAIMDKKIPLDVLARNIEHVRNLSLLDTKHKKHAALWNALAKHRHIDRLEIHDAVFPVKKLIGPKTHTLAHLKLSGNCTRMHPFLLIFVERQVHLKSLELTRFKFTASDWKRIITKKPHLRKLVIGQQCDFLDFKSFDEEDVMKEEDKKEDKKVVVKKVANSKQALDSMAMDVDKTPPTGSGIGSKRKSDDDSIDTRVVVKRRRKNRASLVNTPLPNAKDFGVLPITHLVLLDNRLLRPFQQAILEASPHLEQLEICYSQKANGGKVAALVRDNCRKIRRLTLRSTRQPWTLAMIDDMPLSVEELILYTGQLDLQMTAAIKERADTLKRLALDFGQGTKGKRRLACILTILRECTELREFSYHNHAEDKVFKAMMFKKQWNLPNLRKLILHGVSPRSKYGGIPQVPTPDGWRQGYGGQKDHCCSARSFEDVRKLGKSTKSPLFDVALLDHVKDLANLSEVVVTEAIYRKQLN
ncbi:hypothetical protein BGW39_001502 [Mortierella sp. 14UC]|nr:hypothetical protein BGW39_001502 [Mortierella sp. 14UC]